MLRPSSNPRNQEIVACYWFWSDEVIQRSGCFDFLDPLQRACGILCLQANLCSEVHNPALKFRMVGKFPQMHLRGKITRIYHATLSTSPNTRGMVSHRLKTISVVQTISLAFPEKQCKIIGCSGSSLPLFSIPSLLWISDHAARLLESLCHSSSTPRAGWQSKTFPGTLLSCRVFRCILDWRLGFLELKAIRA